MVAKKRKSKRLSTRKKNKIIKKIRKQEKDRRKTVREDRKKMAKLPKQVLMTDEDLEQQKLIKINELRRKTVIIDKIENSFFDNKDLIVVVVDPRDRRCLNTLNINNKCIIILNYKSNMILKEFQLLSINYSKCFICCEDNVQDDWLISKNREFNLIANSFKNIKIGILGEANVGKNFVKKKFDLSCDIQINTIEGIPDLSGLLRKTVSYRKVLCKDLLNIFISNLHFKDDLSRHFNISYFYDCDMFIKLMVNKYKLKGNKYEEISKILIKEVEIKKIMLWLDVHDRMQIVYQ